MVFREFRWVSAWSARIAGDKMLNQEILLESTESYLKSLVAEASASIGTDFDISAPFGELGIDSFRVLKIIKALEADFGTLPKTLLFENFNVESLARYFVDKHSQTLNVKFAKVSGASGPATQPVKTVATAESVVPQSVAAVAPAPAPDLVVLKTPIRLLESDLPAYPELDAIVKALFDHHKNEGCVSRGTRNIAPNLFIGSERKGYFNYSRCNGIVLIYAYTGPEEYFPEIATEMYRYCVEKNFQLNIFVDKVIESIDGVPFSATPFGALQRVLDIQNFTLEGGAMRRLRYQVAKFEKAGVCRTQEYKCGTDKAVDASIAEVIDRWCSTKPMVNPLIHIVREEILAGTLHPQHRLFLTYCDDTLQNVILISRMCESLNGYLMDLEFYGKDMPLGGLEFAITKIIEALAAEGCSMLSMGGTYGCRLETSPHADPDVDKILDDLHKQNIFNDEGNLQFKNKFRPENKTIYICRPVGSGKADNVIDIIMMIADPAKVQTSDAENHNADAKPVAVPATPPVVANVPVAPPPSVVSLPAPSALAHAPSLASAPRSSVLAEFGFNPLNIPDDRVDYDLKTDSWSQLNTAPFVEAQMAHLRGQLQQPLNVNESLSALFPFKYFVLTDAGRTADHLFCKAWLKKGVVLENLLFPTCIYHQIDKGFTPHELPHPEAFRLDSDHTCKADLDWAALQDYVSRHADKVAFVCIEVCDNAVGGYPVSLAHLKQVKELLVAHAISLVIDGTRILENARYLIEHDPAQAGRALWDVAREILSHADAVFGSLTKDFCVNKGGLIATNDEGLLRRLQDFIEQEGGGLNVIEKKLIAVALNNRKQIESWVVRRMRAVEAVWQALKNEQVPVVRPVGGHCVVIDVKRIPEFGGLENPVAAFVAWLYLNTGIRAGAHSAGMQKNTPLNELVRLAIPVGLKNEQVEDIIRRLVQLFREKKNIPEVKLRSITSEAHGEVVTHFDLIRYHRVAPQDSLAVQEVPRDAAPLAATVATPPAPTAPAAAPAPTVPRPLPSRTDIAVVGMAGRYPKAPNLLAFWENLRDGRDCISDLPQDRIARRVKSEYSRSYRGGFIDDIDKFDSLFFSISPREAEVLDPQERLFLEVAWEVLEDAGYFPEMLVSDVASRSVGVFVGAVWAMYQIVGVEEKLAGNNVSPNSFLWSIANRVSYWMNFTGPSLTVDTACSSSLTALHLACEAIQNGDCTSAIVGGVNLDLHQHKFDINYAGGALSRDGVCRSFGAGANGYVAGEGVGAVYLKPLAKALEDSDNIYGVIKSVVVNHGGRTSGYTVPNPKAQGDLIAVALEKAGVDARTIGYIEAHGTGTELGDPVEISGLCGAFELSRVGNQTCSIGSVKTNIGHLEAGAGVVGVCKLLLQMKYRQLVPSLHSAELNAHIDFKHSPFYVQQRLEAWNEKEVDGVKYPLRAGISSFGAGGANAHAVIENVTLPVVEPVMPPGGHVFPLSARNEEQLRETAIRLRDYLELDFVQHKLCDIAFTLQNGRKSFEYRMAVVAQSKSGLIEKLGLFVEGKKDADVLVGHAKNSDGITKLLSRTEKEQFITLLSQSRDPHKLAQLWIDGLLSDCRGFPLAGGRRTSLPTYPFADKRHWIGTSQGAAGTLAIQAARGVHPLIDSNESTFLRQVFKKTFRDREFFIRDHVVSGVPTLPGTAYLDLARKAGELAAGRKVQKIRNVTWVSPLAVEGTTPTVAFVELKPSEDSVLFEVFSETDDGKRRLYSQGKLLYAAEQGAAEVEHLDIAAIRARCTRTIAAKDAYPLFDALGMHYGPSFQVLQEVHKGEDEVLGVLQIPDVRSADFDDFALHPCILDAAMQAGVVAQLGDKSGEMKVPYSIGEVELLHPLTRTCFSYVTKVKSERNTGSGVSRENVTIVDEAGKVLARIREAVGVPLVSVHEKAAPAQREEEYDTLYYSHVWQKAPLPGVQRDVASLLLFDTDDRLRNACVRRNIRVVLVLPRDQFEDLGSDTYGINPQDRQDHQRLLDTLSQKNALADKVCYAWPDSAEARDENALKQALDRGVYAFLNFCQALIEQKPKGRVQILYLHYGQQGGAPAYNDAINGFVRSLRLENPKFDAKVLEIRQDTPDPDPTADLVLAELHAGVQEDITVRYEHGVRSLRVLKKMDLAAQQGTRVPGIALKQNGVYLITGGAGGLGLIFAEFLAKECQAKLVLTGRSSLPAEREADLDRLRSLGAEVLYVAADVSRAEDAQRLLRETKARFGGALHGIIHSAGVLRDAFLRKKTREEMEAVFAPKVFGTFHLDELTRDEDLDFFVLFSSLAAVGGNAGQCDYAFANHYMDSFAASRERLRASGLRTGRTLSINWSLWADGGMKLDEQTELFFKKNLGIVPLRTVLGLDAFLAGLAVSQPHIAVLEGVQAKIELAWGITKKEAPAPAPASSPSGQDAAASVQGDLTDVVIQALSEKVVEMLKLSAGDLSLDSILLDLGFDSIGLTTFANAINAKYQLDINPVLFFEYPSIRAIAGVLATDHRSAVEKVHGGGKPQAAAAAPTAPTLSIASPAQTASDDVAATSFAIRKGWEPPASLPSPAQADGFTRALRFVKEPIAIVGIAGVMPQSENLEEFWDNLKNARNMVTEIPRDRWIWEDYDGNPYKEANKSNSRWGGFMKEVDKFDPLFFGITPREAEMMDPQQRILLETVWSAIEDSGQKVSDLSGTRTGFFVGASSKDYIDVLAENNSTLDGFSASGNSHSILANRISFLLNLRGPSAPLDTACSSSLVALHRAIESIHTGSCDMAIIGGVQVMLTPVGHVSLSSAGMLSIDGKCKTFDKDANGYVRGEGSGAIFIKPLAKAEEDGNPIYAVIKATAENHGGRVTMLTAPNPKAQAELLFEAYEKGQVDPATVGYIECHGTGTSLGDPIEIQALKKSFADLYKKHNKALPTAPHCGLSSVKTNIGHLEPAAGMASLLKVLLSIKHKQIPALLHFQELNPYIDLAGSPFYIVDKTTDWPAIAGEDGQPLPRCAGVSSFGWGGANAHVVLEEYIPPIRQHSDQASGPKVVVLSAKNDARLKAYARTLLAHVNKHDVDLNDLAYTLQVGRDPMEERLGLIVNSVTQLAEKLNAYLRDGELGTEDAFQGRIGRYKRNAQGLSVESDANSAVKKDDIDGWIAAANYAKLAEAWVSGVEVDWSKLYAARSGALKPRRVSLPTYPFARDRHWITPNPDAKTAKAAGAGALHPLLHTNTSTLKQQCFSTVFSGKEFFLIDHQKTLPVLAYVEMAREAVLRSAPSRDETAAVEMLDTAWAPGIAISQSPVVVDVVDGRNGQIGYEIHSAEHDEDGRVHKVVHCKGSARYASRVATAKLDIDQIKALMKNGKLAGEQVEALQKDMTPKRGALLQTLTDVYYGNHQLLARLDLPQSQENTRQDYVLHPSIMDGVVQSAIALANLDFGAPKTLQPSALGALQVLAPCSSQMYAWIRYTRGSRSTDDTIRLDIDVTNSSGDVCIRLKSLAINNTRTDTRDKAEDQDFAALLDSVYRLEAEASHSADTGTSTSEFERMLEEIL